MGCASGKEHIQLRANKKLILDNYPNGAVSVMQQ